MTYGLVVDNFAGGGGASTGIEAALGRPVDLAVNHWRAAMDTHERNHPGTVHLCEDVFKVSPRKVCAELWRRKGLVGTPRVSVAWFSPDCRHFSRAKGGVPVSRKIRGLAWVAIKWAEQVRPEQIYLENVPEFLGWGPVKDGKPDLSKKGLTFKKWLGRLRNLGYRVEWRELVAADYGAPTTRKRLFVIARCDGKPIVWPEATHGNPKEIEGQGDMCRPALKPWRTAAECIDWSLPCPSIFERKRPLKEKTLKRIAAGIRRFVIDNPEPFIMSYYGPKGEKGYDRGAALEDQLPTVPTENRFALVVPSIMPLTHDGNGARGIKPGEPMPTVTGAHRGEQALVAASIARIGQTGGGGDKAYSVEQPVTTVTSKAEHLLCTAFLAKHFGGVVGIPANVPAGAITAKDHHGLVTATLVGCGGRAGQSAPCAVDEPMRTTTSKADRAIATAHLMKLYGTSTGAALDGPMPTVTGQGGHLAEVRAFLIKYYGNERGGVSLADPMDTVTSKDRLGLVYVHGEPWQIVDIGMRMLQPHELAAAQGFPATYILPKNKSEAVALIGNSVCPPVAEAIVRANMPEAEKAEAVA
ncbi:MAG: DNA cytosine methyltransferase [Bryobacteraceae bacterium]